MFQTVVDLVCPETFSVVANPIDSLTIVDWEEPHLTGWNGTNFTSTAVSGGGFMIGEHEVTYHQWFGFNNLVLQCSFVFRVIGKLFVKLLYNFLFTNSTKQNW